MKKFIIGLLVVFALIIISTFDNIKQENQLETYIDKFPTANKIEDVFAVDDVEVEIEPIKVADSIDSYTISINEIIPNQQVEVTIDNFIYNSFMELVESKGNVNAKYMNYELKCETVDTIEKDNHRIDFKILDENRFKVVGYVQFNGFDIYYVSTIQADYDQLDDNQKEYLLNTANKFFDLVK